MKNNRRNQSQQFTSVSNTLGLSLILTTLGVTSHHLWRKKNNPNAKISDYFYGLAEQIERLEEKKYLQKSTMNTNPPKSPFEKGGLPPSFLKRGWGRFNKVQWVSGVANIKGGESDEFSVVGIDGNRQIVWQTPVSERVHDIVVQPNHPLSLIRGGLGRGRSRHVAVMGRRPSEYFWIMDCATGQILYQIQAENDRHYYGHACYSLDGDLLYVSENDTDTFNGMIGVYQVSKNYQKIAEFSTHGIGPHEIIMHPDGDKLIVANGGIKTERASREELNLETMQPSLVYLSLEKNNYGAVLQQLFPKHNQMSIRHLSAVTTGKLKNTVAIGIQFQGEKHLDIPLVLTHKFGDKNLTEYVSTSENKDWRQFHHYIASIIVNSAINLLCVTSPIGGCVSVFDMDTQTMIGSIKISDCAGIAVAGEGFLVSDGRGGLTLLKLTNGHLVSDSVPQTQSNQSSQLTVAFDNHMQRVCWDV